MQASIDRPSTLTELAQCYSVHRSTMRRWLKQLGIHKDSRATAPRNLYTPEEISRIVQALGMPRIELTIAHPSKHRRQ